MKYLIKSTFKTLLLLLSLVLSNISLQAQSDNILSIDGLDFGAGIVVMWETLNTGKSGQSFIIERALSADADFEKIGEITANTEDNQKQFAFEDRELGLKNAYYRIKILEKGAGIESYSEVVPVKKDVINNFLIQDAEKIDKHQYRVSVLSVVDGEIKYQLATNLGEVVMKQSFEMQKGENDFIVDLEAEADGAYIASFQNDSYTITKNFSKKSEKDDNVARKD